LKIIVTGCAGYIGGDTPYSVLDIVKMFSVLLKKEIKLKMAERKNDVVVCTPNLKFALNKLGWTNKKTIENVCLSVIKGGNIHE